MTVDDDPKLEAWSVRALNMPEHFDNAIHTDVGAKAAGYPGAIVSGTTVYAYLTHPAAAGWGRSWIDGGGAEVRFRAAVFDDDLVDCLIEDETIEASVGGSVRASLDVWKRSTPPGDLVGDRLPSVTFSLDDELGGYGTRAGDDLALYAEQGIVHPAAWPCIGNRVTKANFVTGPWIHVRSKVSHLGTARFGVQAQVESTLVDRFDSRAGERVLLDVRVSIDGLAVAAIEHESIVKLAAHA